MIRVGIGYDVHQLVVDRPLIIGGITIPHEKGLLGHSDADVLLHAITDALMGALAMGSIGDRFPDTDPAYKGANSIELMLIIYQDIKKMGYTLGNLDTVIVAQEPKFKPFIAQIQKNIANVLSINNNQVGIKATTTEHLGFEGRKEGISAHAIVQLVKV